VLDLIQSAIAKTADTDQAVRHIRNAADMRPDLRERVAAMPDYVLRWYAVQARGGQCHSPT